jgi:biopolymer transport protein TolR
MAMVGGGESGGRRKSLNADVNLVPFIDLLSMCICFLLMTAVWVQIGALQVKQSHGTQAAATTGLDLDLRFLGPSSVLVQLQKNHKTVRQVAVQEATPEALLVKLDAAINPLVSLAIGSPITSEQVGTVVTAAMVTPKDGVPYGTMVGAMDALRKHTIVNIGVVPVGGQQ